jgi:nitroimidazol reductase NimA-like FMN-containing flavoprotein (pyridoxamine 5'-phosphate oxidase superfamily)
MMEIIYHSMPQVYFSKNKQMVGELTKEQISNLLSSQMIGRIACCDIQKPYIVPIAYAYDGKDIYCQTTEGKKVQYMRENPNICFQIDFSNSISNWQSIIVYGKFEELAEQEIETAREFLMNKIMPLMTNSKIHPHEHWETREEKLDDSHRIKPIIFKIKIEDISGKYHRM